MLFVCFRQDKQNVNQFKHATNLPKEVYLQEGARVMFLNNKMFDENICNRTVGGDNKTGGQWERWGYLSNIRQRGKDIVIQKETSYFEIDGKRASRKQFPFQNAFSLTVHKTQRFDLTSRNHLYRREHICRRTGVCGIEQGWIFGKLTHFEVRFFSDKMFE